MAQLDHMILPVNDAQQSIDFYTSMFGFTYEGERRAVLRGARCARAHAPAGSVGYRRRRYTSRFADVAHANSTTASIAFATRELSMATRFMPSATCRGPATKTDHAARAKPLRPHPSKHLIEIRHYESESV